MSNFGIGSGGGGGGGVSTVGAFSGSAQTNGASISSTTITFGPADASTPGMLSTGSQVIAGAKRFSTSVWIGSAPSANYAFSVDAAPVLTGGNYISWFSISRQTAVANYSEPTYGLYAQTYLNISTFNSSGQNVGSMGEVRHAGSGTVDVASGVRGYVANISTGTVVDAISLRASGHANSGGGSITNAIGVYLVDQTSGTNNYGIYSNMSSGSGKYFLYTTSDAQSLHTGNFLLGGGASAAELRFLEPSGSGSNYTAFKAQAQAGDVTYTLPAADGTSGYFLSTNGSGTLSWAAGGSGTVGGTGTDNTLTRWNGTGNIQDTHTVEDDAGVQTVTCADDSPAQTNYMRNVTMNNTYLGTNRITGTVSTSSNAQYINNVSLTGATNSTSNAELELYRTTLSGGSYSGANAKIYGHYMSMTTANSVGSSSMSMYNVGYGSFGQVVFVTGGSSGNAFGGGFAGYNSLFNVGVAGIAFGGVSGSAKSYAGRFIASNDNSSQAVGIYVGLNTSMSQAAEEYDPAASGVIIANNGATTANIADLRDNGTTVFKVADGGACTLGGSGGTQTHAVNGHIDVTGQGYSEQDTETQAASTTHTIDWNDGNSTVWDLQSATGNITLTLSNPVAGASYIIKIIQSSTARTVTFPATVKWAGGVAPTLTTTNDAVDLITLYYDGTNYLCSYGLDIK